jgi:predicted O-methyltransferase YrrM
VNIVEHFYQEIDGWFDFEELYREAVRRTPALGKMVEVGVYNGRSCFFLAVEAQNAQKGLDVVAVDRFDHRPMALDDFSRLRREHGLADTLSLIVATSVQAARQFDDATLDFVFIDADHEYESVKADIAAWWPKVKPGGILAGHDFAPEFPGVMLAVREAFKDTFLPYPPRSWWVDKR